MRTTCLVAAVIFFFAAVHSAPVAQTRPAPSTGLQIYVVDVEGGNAVLYVAPSGNSLLIDSGNGGAGAVRDAERIVAAAKDAGLTEIDHLITTHWHGDHYGGMAELAARIPVRHYIDHGGNVQPNQATDDFLAKTYADLTSKATHTVVRPGDRIAMTGLEWRIVASGGQVIRTALPGGGRPNPYCAGFTPQEADPTENAQSVGSVVTFGRFRVVQLGDLTWNKEFELMCPVNPIGTVDLFVISHHGLNISNSAALIHALHPRVIIMNNGIRKGGQPETMKTIFGSPGLEDLWQVHFSQLSGQEYTAPGAFIANTFDEPLESMPIAGIAPPAGGRGGPPVPAHNGPAYWIKVTAYTDGSFTVVNGRNQFTKTYR
jgi:competence protein ComEC